MSGGHVTASHATAGHITTGHITTGHLGGGVIYANHGIYAHPGYGYNNIYGRNFVYARRPWYGYGWGWPFGFGYGFGGYGYSYPVYVPIVVPYFPSTYMLPPVEPYDPYSMNPYGPPGGQVSPPSSGNSASIELYLPNNSAEVWFNDLKTQQTGQKREYVTPDLEPGKSFTYQVRAKWVEDGKEYDQTRTVTVRAGAQIVFAFYAEKREKLPPPSEEKK
jgi:uncharacterized protein (TIGR03000 family)